jgi:hypothetical protein
MNNNIETRYIQAIELRADLEKKINQRYCNCFQF